MSRRYLLYEQAVRRALEEWIASYFKNAQFEVYGSRHLKGTSGAVHQIDVSADINIEFTLRVIAECKCYKRTIDKSLVQSFVLVKQDLGAQLGIMYSTKGFQSGAMTIAEAHGVKLVVQKQFSRRGKWDVLIPAVWATELIVRETRGGERGSSITRPLYQVSRASTGSPDTEVQPDGAEAEHVQPAIPDRTLETVESNTRNAASQAEQPRYPEKARSYFHNDNKSTDGVVSRKLSIDQRLNRIDADVSRIQNAEEAIIRVLMDIATKKDDLDRALRGTRRGALNSLMEVAANLESPWMLSLAGLRHSDYSVRLQAHQLFEKVSRSLNEIMTFRDFRLLRYRRRSFVASSLLETISSLYAHTLSRHVDSLLSKDIGIRWCSGQAIIGLCGVKPIPYGQLHLDSGLPTVYKSDSLHYALNFQWDCHLDLQVLISTLNRVLTEDDNRTYEAAVLLLCGLPSEAVVPVLSRALIGNRTAHKREIAACFSQLRLTPASNHESTLVSVASQALSDVMLRRIAEDVGVRRACASIFDRKVPRHVNTA